MRDENNTIIMVQRYLCPLKAKIMGHPLNQTQL